MNPIAYIANVNSVDAYSQEFQPVELEGIDRFYGRFLAGELSADEFSNVLDLHIQFSNA